jgi:glycosyltransferase involved in cell wall biosynthesis
MRKRGIPAIKITVIHNAVTSYAPERPKGWVREEFGIGPDEVILVTIGSLIPRKLIDFLLRACAALGTEGKVVGCQVACPEGCTK